MTDEGIRVVRQWLGSSSHLEEGTWTQTVLSKISPNISFHCYADGSQLGLLVKLTETTNLSGFLIKYNFHFYFCSTVLLFNFELCCVFFFLFTAVF